MSRRLSLLVLFAMLGTCFAAGTATAARLYVPNYGSGPPEEIGGFDLGSDGSLTPISGSPFPATLAGDIAMRKLAFTPDGGRAATGFFVGTGGVQGYTVPASGIFSLSGGFSPTASVTSVAITPDGRFAYASTREFGGKPAEGIHRFAVDGDGSLIPLGAPTPVGGSSEDVAISPDGRFLFAEQGNSVERFAIEADGSLTALGPTPVSGAYLLSTSADQRFLYVFLDDGGVPGLAVFEIGADGGLTQRGLPTYLGAGTVGRSFAVAPDGRFAFLIDRSDGGRIATVAIAEDGAPSVLPGGVQATEGEAVVVSPDGRLLVSYHNSAVGYVLDVAAIGADGSLTDLPGETPWSNNEGTRMTFQPQPTPVVRFTAQAAAPGDATRFDASGSTGAARYDWDFGDGTTLADGGPNPTHAYAQAGAYDVTLSVFDRNGCAARHYYDGQSTVCPGGSTTTAGGKVDTLPVLGKPKAVPKKFAPKVKGAKQGRVKLGTSFRYTVNEAARVRFTIERKLKKKGRRVRFKRVGNLTKRAKAGRNKLKWNGKLKGKPLPAGSYRATVVATDAAGGQSPPKKVGFRILSPPQHR